MRPHTLAPSFYIPIQNKMVSKELPRFTWLQTKKKDLTNTFTELSLSGRYPAPRRLRYPPIPCAENILKLTFYYGQKPTTGIKDSKKYISETCELTIHTDKTYTLPMTVAGQGANLLVYRITGNTILQKREMVSFSKICVRNIT